MSTKWNLELRGFYEQLNGENKGPGDYKNWGTTLDGQWYFLRERGANNRGGFQPYAVLGAGAMQDKVPGQSDYSFIANGGLGFNWAFSDWGRLVGDARYRWDDNSGDIAGESSFQDVIVSVGLQIPLGPKPLVAEAPRAVTPTPVAPPPKPVQRAFELSADALFAFNSAALTAVGRSRIDEVVTAARGTGFTATSVQIVGHTDPLGSEAYNQRLSEKRAMAVRDYMVSQGISPDSIQTEGRGETQLKITEAECSSQGQAKTAAALIACLAPDRRVDAVISGTQTP